MIDRRQFLQILSGAVAAIATVAQSTPEAPKVEYTHSDSPRFGNPDGIEVMEGTQPMDADYLQVTVTKWKNERIEGRRRIMFTRQSLKGCYDDFNAYVKSEIQRAIGELSTMELA